MRKAPRQDRALKCVDQDQHDQGQVGKCGEKGHDELPETMDQSCGMVYVTVRMCPSSRAADAVWGWHSGPGLENRHLQTAPAPVHIRSTVCVVLEPRRYLQRV